MSTYLIQASYAASATANLVKNPQDRALAISSLLERNGGKLLGMWFALGESDIVCIAELPTNVEAAAFSMAVGSSGAMSSFRTTALLTTQQAVEAMKKAGAIGYQPPR